MDRATETASRGRGRNARKVAPAGGSIPAGVHTLRSMFAVRCIDLAEATGLDGVTWEPFQLDQFNDTSRLSISLKSRQVAWSFTAAAEGWIDAALYGTSSIFVSINLDEAKEKIRYARALYEATRDFKRPAIRRDNDLSLEFANGASLVSLPSRPPRGKARRNVYLDEFAHVARDRDIYRGALPVISKGGRLRIGSSPMGARGLFWEIYTQSMNAYPDYRRFAVPWWEVRAFCSDIIAAGRMAPEMSTEDRVSEFGSETLRMLYANTVREDFLQEYECTFVDEAASWITWEEIAKNQSSDLVCLEGDYVQQRAGEAFNLIEALRKLCEEGLVESSLGAGVDIGRTRNTTELYIGGTTTTDVMPLRLAISLDGVTFEDQEAIISRALEVLPIHTMLIDKNGLGMNLAENLSRRFPAKVRGFEFTNPSKKLLATDTKMFFQAGRAPIPKSRDLAYQIHSIRRKVSASGVFIFDTEASEKHHADKFWSLALMLHAIGGRRTMAGRAAVRTVS